MSFMLTSILVIFVVLAISTAGAAVRLEGTVLADIARGTFEATPGTARVVEKLRQQGVLQDDGGRLLVNEAARVARQAAAKAQMVRTAVIAVSLAGLAILATKRLLDQSGS
jgi:hypothetical protein